MTFLAMLFAFVLSLFPFGFLLVMAMAFGMIYSIYNRNKEMYEDLQLIKEKLGMDAAKDRRLEEYLVEQELERSEHADPAVRTEIDMEIERELEEYLDHQDSDNDDGTIKRK